MSFVGSGATWWIYRSRSGLHVIADRMNQRQTFRLATALLQECGWQGKVAASVLAAGARLWL